MDGCGIEGGGGTHLLCLVHDGVEIRAWWHVSSHVDGGDERDGVHVHVEIHGVLIGVHAGWGGHGARGGARTRARRGHHGELWGCVVSMMGVVGADGGRGGGTVGGEGGDVVGLAWCAVVGLMRGRGAVVLAGGALVCETGAAFVLCGCAGCAIGVDGLLLSLEGGAFLGGHLGVAERVHGGLKGNAHGGILGLIWGGRDVGDLLHAEGHVGHALLDVVHGADVDGEGVHGGGGGEGDTLLLLEELGGGEGEWLVDLVGGMGGDELGRGRGEELGGGDGLVAGGELGHHPVDLVRLAVHHGLALLVLRRVVHRRQRARRRKEKKRASGTGRAASGWLRLDGAWMHSTARSDNSQPSQQVTANVTPCHTHGGAAPCSSSCPLCSLRRAVRTRGGQCGRAAGRTWDQRAQAALRLRLSGFYSCSWTAVQIWRTTLSLLPDGSCPLPLQIHRRARRLCRRALPRHRLRKEVRLPLLSLPVPTPPPASARPASSRPSAVATAMAPSSSRYSSNTTHPSPSRPTTESKRVRLSSPACTPTHPPTVDRDALQDIPNVYTSQAFVETDKAGYLIRQCIASNLYDRIRCVPLFPRRPLDPPSPKHPSISLRHRKEVDRLPAPHRSLPRPPPKDPSWRHQVHQRPRHLLKLDIPHRLCPLQANPSPPRRSLRLFIFLRHQWQAHLLRRSRALLQGRKRVQVHGPGRLQALSHRGDGRL